MARLETWYKQDLKKPLIVHKHADVFNQDSRGNLIGVEVYSDGEPVTLTGSISGYCLLADGTTVPAVGASRSGNKASVLIPQTAYNVPGVITITIKNVDGNDITTLCAVVGLVRQSVSGNLVNPGSVVTDWSNSINAQLQAVQDAADNVGAIVAAPFAKNTVYVAGNYVTNNGNLYRITGDHVAGVTWANTQKVQCTVGTELYDLKAEFNSKVDYEEADTRNIFTAYGAVAGLPNASGVVIGTAGKTTDFLPVEPETLYGAYNSSLNVQSLYLVAFYDSNKAFISRILGASSVTSSFTTPADCYYIRVGNNGSVLPAFNIVKNGELLPSVPNKKIANKESIDTDDWIWAKVRLFGIPSMLDEISLEGSITGSIGQDHWYIDSSRTNRHVLIPVNEGDIIEMKASKQGFSYAMLKSAKMIVNTTPDFVYKYILREYESGEQSYEIEYDSQGNPVLDTRHAVKGKSIETFKCVPGTKYVYILQSYFDASTNTSISALPVSIKINGWELMPKNEEAEESDDQLSTVFFDDFDSLNTNIWTLHTQNPLEDSEQYQSRFYTDERNVRVEQSMLIMSVIEDTTENHGTYIDANGNQQPVKYLAPYISTCDSVVIPSGRISARMRASHPLGKAGFMWCFWTFGQNEAWGYAHEADIIESTQRRFSEQTETRLGRTIPIGSVRNVFGFNLHYVNDNGIAAKSTYKKITLAFNDNNSLGDDEILLGSADFSVTDWHVYAIEWDETNISVFIDDLLLSTYKAEDIGALDENGNNVFAHPQDIRFNIKRKLDTTDESGYLLIDWVKAEANKTPCLTISHPDVQLAVNDYVYIEPTFNSGCSNKAFIMETDDTEVVEIQKYLNDSSQMVVHRINGKSAGSATVRLRSANGVTSNTFVVTVT